MGFSFYHITSIKNLQAGCPAFRENQGIMESQGIFLSGKYKGIGLKILEFPQKNITCNFIKQAIKVYSM